MSLRNSSVYRTFSNPITKFDIVNENVRDSGIIKPTKYWGMNQMAATLSQKLKELRTQKKLTLDQLSEQSGLSKSYIWELENRESQRPSAEQLDALARVLSVSIDYFLENDVHSPEDRHLDDAFFRGYRNLDQNSKEHLRNILEAFQKKSQ